MESEACAFARKVLYPQHGAIGIFCNVRTYLAGFYGMYVGGLDATTFRPEIGKPATGKVSFLEEPHHMSPGQAFFCRGLY